MAIDWKIGPARCANSEYEVYIVGKHGDFYVGIAWSVENKVSFPAMWHEDGKNATGHRSLDLLPPAPKKMTREEIARECEKARITFMNEGPYGRWIEAMLAALDRYDELTKGE